MNRYLLLFITSLFIIGCDSDSTTTNVTSGVADPFKTGNYWVYQNTYYSPGGAIDSTKIDSVAVTSTRIEGVNKRVEYSDGHTETHYNLGIYHSGPGELWYKYPANANDTFYFRGNVPAKIGDTSALGDIYRIVSRVNDIVTVTAGTFSTYQYMVEITKANIDTTLSRGIDNFSPNIGLVKSELYSTSSLTPPLYIIFRKELIRYYLQ